MRNTGVVTLGALIGGGFYLLLIDTNDLPELYVLAGVALACGFVFLIAREEAFAGARIGPASLFGAWRLAIRIPLDIAIVCAAAVAQLMRPRQSRGALRTARFRAVAQTPQDTARRALTEALGSVTPNTIVIGVDAERELLVVHQLHRQGPAEDLDLLRLG